MREDKRSTQPRSLPINFFFFLLLFSYPVLSLLWRRSYPVFTEETLWIFLGIAVISMVFSLILASVRPIISYLLTAMLILVCFMIQFGLLLEGIAISICGIALLMYVFKYRFHFNGLLILVALMVGAYLDSNYEPMPERSERNATAINPERPPVVHILLDGFIGIGGLPDIPSSNIIRKEVLSFFESNDFLLFSHAYSRYAITGDSLYTALNFRHNSENTFILEKAVGVNHVLEENAVFSALEMLDYRLNIYQTNHIDFCHSHPELVDRCWQYDHPNIHSTFSSKDTGLKVSVLLKTLLHQSVLLEIFLPDLIRDALDPVAVHDPRVFELLDQDIRKRGPGNYFFAHALIPHSPFIYQPDCSAYFEAPSHLKVSSHKNEPVLPNKVYEIRNGLYFGQMECALKNLQTIFDSLREIGLYERAIIVVHGDHGPLISKHRPLVKNLELMEASDYRAAFSTLFAVKYPGSTFSVDSSPLPLAYLLEEFFSELPSYVVGANKHTIFRPSDDASPEKTGLYVYLDGGFPRRPVSINIFED